MNFEKKKVKTRIMKFLKFENMIFKNYNLENTNCDLNMYFRIIDRIFVIIILLIAWKTFAQLFLSSLSFCFSYLQK